MDSQNASDKLSPNAVIVTTNMKTLRSGGKTVQSRFTLRAVPFHTVFYSVLLLLHGSNHAQVSSPPSPETPPTIRVSSQFVMLDALIENKQAGSLPGNLRLTDFRLSEDGVPQKITYFSQDRQIGRAHV